MKNILLKTSSQWRERNELLGVLIGRRTKYFLKYRYFPPRFWKTAEIIAKGKDAFWKYFGNPCKIIEKM